MHFTTSEVRQRNAYAENSLAEALSVLHTPLVALALGSEAIRLTALFESAQIANYQDDLVSIPKSYAVNPDTLIVTATKASSSLTLSADFMQQTSIQRRITLEHLDAMKPRGQQTSRSLYNMLVGFYDHKMGLAQMLIGPNSHAQTGSSTLAYTHDTLRRFTDFAPSNGVTMIQYRPLTMFVMKDDTQKNAPPDVTIHEGVHALQIIQKPVTDIRSQRNADMQALRVELDAYHAGALIALQQARKQGSNLKLEEYANSISGVQIGVNTLREQNLLDASDPFKPSGMLMDVLREHGFGSILHMTANYSQIHELAIRSDKIPDFYLTSVKQQALAPGAEVHSNGD